MVIRPNEGIDGLVVPLCLGDVCHSAAHAFERRLHAFVRRFACSLRQLKKRNIFLNILIFFFPGHILEIGRSVFPEYFASFSLHQILSHSSP